MYVCMYGRVLFRKNKKGSRYVYTHRSRISFSLHTWYVNAQPRTAACLLCSNSLPELKLSMIRMLGFHDFRLDTRRNKSPTLFQQAGVREKWLGFWQSGYQIS